ncbi:hypothetical protein ANCDUO_02152 [Ancylostoma duodenale]|uniref:Uncharacterized protein n=1 Tax=Ancylostoma duodenale TaxID=51022 RepID=A0A0C2DX67_9BILA|nr:hypothetical protein ANCDUO_02152 [Ancylostoma duodenale]
MSHAFRNQQPFRDCMLMVPSSWRKESCQIGPQRHTYRKVIVSKSHRTAGKESLQVYRRTTLLEAAETKSSIKRCKKNLNEQKNVMAALKDEEGETQFSRRAMENIV